MMLRLPLILSVLLVPVPVLLAPGSAVAQNSDDEILNRGRQIYQKSCASCHGDTGQGGTDSYDDPLIGDSTVGELTELISETMPEEDPDSCVAEDAASVASFIHHAFYSEAARIRNRPPRVVFARLTAEQLRQSLADLYTRMDGREELSESRRGLEGVYFEGSRWKEDKKRIERVDPVLEFDFGDAGPGEGIDPKDFYIHWGGSLIANQSGRYEIVLRSTCSCQLHFGDTDRILVNNHVQSEGKTEFRRTIRLTAGRPYPIKIQLFQRKRKTKQPPAKISLSWVPPGGVEEIIPERFLIPVFGPAQFALQTKLPPDDRSYGYERGTSINRQWDDSTTAAALEFAKIAHEELWPEYRRRNRKKSDENRKLLRDFLSDLVETAFRSPLDDAARKVYIDKQLDAAEDDGEAIRRVLLISLKSPRFLYPTLHYELSSSHQVANRLALVLYDSLPSERWLTMRVEKNQIQNDRQIEEVARRMASSERTTQKIRAFLYQWFDLDSDEEISKDIERFPGFDQRLVSDLKDSFDAFLDEVIRSEANDYRELIKADWTFTNERLASFYGDSWKPVDEERKGLTRSVADPERRSGAITHPLLMSRFAHHKSTSPIHRGVMLYRHVLGRTLRPPNAAFDPLDADLHPGLTTRERIEMQTGDVDCQVCHQKINALGFVLENFDAAGRYQDKDNGKDVDPSGEYIDRSGKKVSFAGPAELANYLSGSDDSHRAFVEAAFEHFVKQPIAAYGADTADELTRRFAESDYKIRELILQIALVVARHQES